MSFLNEGKEFLVLGTEQLKYQKDTIKLKLKIYGMQKKIETDFFTLGQKIYDYQQNNEEDILERLDIKDLINTISAQKEIILDLEEKILQLNEVSSRGKEKIKSRGENLLEGVKKRWKGEEVEKLDKKQGD